MIAIHTASTILLACLVLAAVQVVHRRFANRHANPKGLPLPPGPKALPLIGNALDIPRTYPWLKLAEMGKKYGGVVDLKAFGRDVIVLNNYDAVTELLENRSSNYSCRPPTQMLYKLIGYEEWSMTFMPYGDTWKKYRKTIHQHFSPTAINKYQGVITEEAHEMLIRLLDNPERFYGQFRLVATSTILRITYGIDVTDPDNPYVTVARDSMNALSQAGIPGKYLVDTFPILRHVPAWVPGAHFKQQASEWKDLAYRFIETPVRVMKQKLARHEKEAAASVVADILHSAKATVDPAEREILARNIGGVAYAGGTETTASSFCSFFVAMVLYPEVQKKAQAELDRVLEGNRLPLYSDKRHLPYIEAIMKEVERWQPVTPFATPHKAVSEDEYNGYYIPKDAAIIGNAWAVFHDEKIFPEPFEFKPERFMKDGKMDPNMIDPNRFAFGFARRVRPGRPFAEMAMFITMASILACFDIGHAYDNDGKPIPVKVECPDGGIQFPKPYQCTIRPRNDNVRSLIEHSLQGTY